MNEYNGLSYSDLIASCYKYLDKIDFKPYIDKYEDLHELIWAVEDDYDNTELTNNNFLEGCVFNWIDEYELSIYLKIRYDVEYREETITKYVRGKLND